MADWRVTLSIHVSNGAEEGIGTALRWIRVSAEREARRSAGNLGREGRGSKQPGPSWRELRNWLRAEWRGRRGGVQPYKS